MVNRQYTTSVHRCVRCSGLWSCLSIQVVLWRMVSRISSTPVNIQGVVSYSTCSWYMGSAIVKQMHHSAFG